MIEAARNVACAGGEPLGFTDCLNFGNPEKPEIGWELSEAIDGIAAACEALGLPVVSGNVSLYNETNGRAIHPTPVVGAVGLVEDVRRVPSRWRDGDVIYTAFASVLSLAGSEYQARFGEVGGTPAPLDLEAEARLVSFLWRAAPLATLVHDAAEGGLAVCLAEAAIHSGCGAALDLRDDPVELFGEVGGRAVVSCAPAAADGIETLRASWACCFAGSARSAGVPCSEWSSTAAASAWESSELMCGVFGIRSEERDVSRLAYFGLFALQHRGQESAGIAVSDGGRLTVLREMGLVAHVFNEQQLQALPGEVAIGHTRYSTTGANRWANAQPLIHHGRERTVALGHNGNLVNVEELRAELVADGIRLASGSDSEVIAALVARDPAPLIEAIANTMQRLEGAYSVTGLADDVLFAFRDPLRLPAADARSDRRRTGSSPPRRARSTSSARRPCGTCARARSSRSTARGCGRSRLLPRAGARSASSSTSTSPAPTRASPGSRCTARASAWASGWRGRRPPRPTS